MAKAGGRGDPQEMFKAGLVETKMLKGTPEKPPLWKSWGKVIGAESEQALGGKLGQGNGFEAEKLIRKPGWSLSVVICLYFYTT